MADKPLMVVQYLIKFKTMRNKEEFSPEKIKEKIIARIEKAFGKDHKIKTAVFKAVSQYNDEYHDYDPVLILIDSNYDEVEHNIRVHDLCPNDEEQWDEETDDMIYAEDLTIKF